MSRKKEFNELEKQLQKKYINVKENEVILRNEDFKDNKLTKAGYVSLKLQSDYIPSSEEIEIRIPQNFQNGFKDQLEYIGTQELSRIKADIKEANFFSLLFFLFGLTLLSLPSIFSVLRTNIVNEVILIVSWVFVWASVEKKFFAIRTLKNKRENILHILSSKIVVY